MRPFVKYILSRPVNGISHSEPSSGFEPESGVYEAPALPIEL